MNTEEIIIQEVHSVKEIESFLGLLGLAAQRFIIKPNWFTFVEGLHTDAKTLDLFLRCLKGEIYVVEAYSWKRNDGTRLITEFNYLENKEWIADQDRIELMRSGMSEVLENHGATYINVTECIWRGDVANSEDIRNSVEDHYSGEGLYFSEFYSAIPKKLYELSQLPDTILLNLAKVKTSSGDDAGFSLSMKNLFGLVPIPRRYQYHGTKLPQAIIDINKVYRSMFKVMCVCEGINTALKWNPSGSYKHDLGNYDLYKNKGFVAGGWNPTTLDVSVAKFFGMNIEHRTLIRLADKHLACFNKETAARMVK
jgi:hypothetical protein